VLGARAGDAVKSTTFQCLGSDEYVNKCLIPYQQSSARLIAHLGVSLLVVVLRWFVLFWPEKAQSINKEIAGDPDTGTQIRDQRKECRVWVDVGSQNETNVLLATVTSWLRCQQQKKVTDLRCALSLLLLLAIIPAYVGLMAREALELPQVPSAFGTSSPGSASD
jgi:hypothetical protein